MDKRLSQLNEAQQKFVQSSQSLIPKIQRVPKFLRQNERFYNYCSPKIVSFGPIHHNSECFKEGEHYKLQWTSTLVAEYGVKIGQDANQACKLLLKKIEDNIEEYKNMFAEDAIEGYNDHDLAWILFVDGCSLIYFMKNIDEQYPKALNLKFDQLMYIWKDALLLENQLPSKMLEILCKENDFELISLYDNYYSMGSLKRILGKELIKVDNPKFFHILDYIRSKYFSSHRIHNIEGQGQMETQKYEVNWKTYKSVRDLKTVGIRVVASKTDGMTWNNTTFKSKWFGGELRLPTCMFNDVTLYIFTNSIAYEMCPDVHYDYECCAFLSFMDSLIDNAEDVKELRSAGILQNLVGNDEELAKFINDLGDHLPTKSCCHVSYPNAVIYNKKYNDIKRQIEKHYKNKWKTWLAEAYNTHFNTPWTMIAFLAASTAWVLCFIQTWVDLHP